MNLFVKFLKLCAERIGLQLNESSLANECGVSTPTINSWLSVLEASFILYRLRPDFRNFNKRVVKTPKLYFYDTGLACSLLEIDSPSQLKSHFARGSLFENLVINEFMKSSLNQGKEPRLSFWRDNVGHEVDLIQDRGGKPYAYEIKSAETFNWEFLDNLNFWISPRAKGRPICGDKGIVADRSKHHSLEKNSFLTRSRKKSKSW